MFLLSLTPNVYSIVPSINSSTTFNTSNTSRFETIALSDTKFLIAYSDGSNAEMRAIVGEVDGKNISLGSPVTLSAGAGSYIDVAELSSGYLIFVWSDPTAGNSGNSVVGRVSGTNISLGTPQQFEADQVAEPRVCALSSNSFTVLYSDDGNSDHGTVITGSVSGSNISYGNADVFETSASTSLDICQVDNDSYLIAYSANSDGILVVGTASGGNNTFGTKERYEGTASAPFARLEPVASRAFACAYQDNANGDYGTIQLLTLLVLIFHYYQIMCSTRISLMISG